MHKYENVTASDKFSEEHYIQHISPRYAFKIYTVSLALFTYWCVYIYTSTDTNALNLKQVLTQNFIKDLV